MPYPAWSLIPFAALLASIATFPLLPGTRTLWHHRWFQLAVALVFGLPMGIWVWARGDHGAVEHALLEYAQFITLLGTLFVVSGGVYVSGDLRATTRNNALVLALGAVLASFIGTTGAAMLLIRPLLMINAQRHHRQHTVVFAIFVIANTGGLLTPLGDPPLFLGMLRGVPFTWTFSLFPAWLVVNALLIAAYVAVDRRLYAIEPGAALARDAASIVPLTVRGRHNLLLLGAVVAAVATLPSIDLHEGHLVPVRELALIGLATVSLRTGDPRVRAANGFTWGPIAEVAALFVGIFLAMIPALAYLRQVAPDLRPGPVSFYAASGLLSSVLDNAPTYATFFEMARGLPGDPRVAGVPEAFLTAVSLGAVLFGGMTYIGNGPNFMVKAIAEEAGVPMPGFAGYTLRWAARYLLPVLVILGLLVVEGSLAARAASGVLAAVYLATAAPRRRVAPDREREVANVSGRSLN